MTSLSSKIVLRTSFSVSLFDASKKMLLLNAPSPLNPSFLVDSIIFRAHCRTTSKSFALIFVVLDDDDDEVSPPFRSFKSISSSSTSSSSSFASPGGNATFIPALKIFFKHFSTFAGSSHPYFSATSRTLSSGFLSVFSFFVFSLLLLSSLLFSLLPYRTRCITREAVTSALLSPRTTNAPISPATSIAFVNSFPAGEPTINPPSWYTKPGTSFRFDITNLSAEGISRIFSTVFFNTSRSPSDRLSSNFSKRFLSSSMKIISGRSSRMIRSVVSAESLETCAVPTRMTSFPFEEDKRKTQRSRSISAGVRASKSSLSIGKPP
mmetsp:Transcript_8559/g.28110  ORF Transcript_8559/g.28110 Transcript_8559/m.28110 type:complete len:322 (+) Transcript_8559:583-1548(+)